MGDAPFTTITPGEVFNIFTNGSLQLKAINKLHEGLYKCNASNGVGNGLEATISFRVIGRHELQYYYIIGGNSS